MAKVKVKDATGVILDYLVAKCEVKDSDCEIHSGNLWYGRVTSGFIQYRPSIDWKQGGPIIEREGITVMKYSSKCIDVIPEEAWYSCTQEHWGDYRECEAHGPTALITAMRCYIVSKLGEEVEVPDELLETQK